MLVAGAARGRRVRGCEECLNGIKITCDTKRPATLEEINSRITDLMFKPDMRELEMNSYEILAANMSALEPMPTQEPRMFRKTDPSTAGSRGA